MGVKEGLSGTKSVRDTGLGPKKTALLVIDMQNDFCSEKGVYFKDCLLELSYYG